MENAQNSPVAISVVVPVYNKAEFLREALDSVLAQTLREIEIICVDDGSTDSSPQILAEYAKKDPRVRVITQENRGVGETRNVGMRAAKGEFIAFLDPDDFLPDNATYETLYSEAKKQNVRACGGSQVFLKTSGRIGRYEEFSGYIVDLAFQQNALRRFAEWQFDYGFYRYIFERKMLLENEIFFPPYIRYQDPIFCARALDAAGTFYALRRKTYVFREKENGPDWTFPRRVCDLLRGLRDELKFSRERGYAKLHYLQIFRLFKEFTPHVVALMQRLQRSTDIESPAEEAQSPDARELSALLREIEPEVDIALARQYKPDLPWFSVREDFLSPRRTPALPRVLARLGAMFILNKSARKRWRERHMDLTPRDGVDVKTLSARELARKREEKRKRNPLRRFFNTCVPATRAKMERIESHLQRANEERTTELLAELRHSRNELANMQCATDKRIADFLCECQSSHEEQKLRISALR